MEFIIKGYDQLIERLKKKNLQKFCAIFLLIVLIVLVIPMLVLSIYNVPNAGDDIEHSIGAHIAWMSSHSFQGFWGTVVAAWNEMKFMYQVMNGNYVSFFTAGLPLTVFSEKLSVVQTFMFLAGLFAGEYLFLKEVMVHNFKLSKNTFLMVYASVMILSTQFLTSARQAFYWWSGCVTNTLGFAATLALMSILFRAYREKKVSVKRCVIGMVLAFFIAGCNYSSLTAFWVLLLFYGLMTFTDKVMDKKDKCKVALILVVLMIGTIISFTAPGNSVRQSYNAQCSYLEAFVNAVVTGRQVFFSYINVKTILFTIIWIPFIWNELDEKREYRLPLLLLFLCCGIFCATLTPTMKADSSYGPRRTRNLYWWIFLNMWAINLTYCMGWLKALIAKKSQKGAFRFEAKHQLGFMIAFLFFALCTIQLEDVKKMPFTQATLDLVSGRAQRFGAQMEERYKLYYSDEKEITVEYIPYVPQLFVEETNPIYANEPGTTMSGDYYLKDSITVKE